MTDRHDSSNDVRRFIDGEMTAAERIAMEARLAEDPILQQQVTTERALRARIAAVMGEPATAPAALRQRIAATLADTGTPPAVTRRSLRPNLLAVAACLALVGGAVLVGIFGPPIDRLATQPVWRGTVSQAADFIAREHLRCRDLEARLNKAVIREPAAIMEDCRLFLGRSIVRLDLEPLGYRLLGSGHCKVPGHECSVHLIYERPGELVTATISIFIQPNVGQFPSFPRGQVLGVFTECTAEDAPFAVAGTSDGAMVYFVACSDERDLGPAAALVTRMVARSADR